MTALDEQPATQSRAARRTPVTPYLALDPSVAVTRYGELAAAFPSARIHYAVKANPHPVLLRGLRAAGAAFDVASPAEVYACLAAGASSDHLLYSNPVKRRSDVTRAYAAGVRTFVVDCVAEVDKVADEAPGSAVLGRLVTSGEGSDWPLSRKFGTTPTECLAVLRAAGERGLGVAGLAFHVGSQQRDPQAWLAPIRTAADLFAQLRAMGHRPGLLDVGGGFPADHEGEQPDLTAYAGTIERAVAESFGAQRPQLVLEPGRGVVGDAGVLVSSVIAVTWRAGRRWVYLDAGVYTGLVETLGEAIRYRLDTPGRSGPTGPVVLAGPTCDSADVLYEQTPVHLPLDLAEGDEVRFRAAGAYTSCYSTVGFNGFEPLPTVLTRP